jgi:hypothetical protein
MGWISLLMAAPLLLHYALDLIAPAFRILQGFEREPNLDDPF